MSRRPQVSKELDEVLQSLGEQAFECEDAADIAGALAKMNEAWDLLPEPKLSWDYFGQSYSRQAAEYALACQEWEQARVWVDRMDEAYQPHNELTTVIVAELRGRYLYHTEEKDQAWALFDLCYKTAGKRYVKGEYLKFYKSYTPTSKSNSIPVGPSGWEIEIPEPGTGPVTGVKLKPALLKKINSLYIEGDNYNDLDAPQAAAECYVKALKLMAEPRTQWAEAGRLYLALGEALLRMSQFDEAHQVLGYALESPESKDNPQVWLSLGDAELALSRSEEALEVKDPMVRFRNFVHLVGKDPHATL